MTRSGSLLLTTFLAARPALAGQVRPGIDSVATLDRARAAQAAFERDRRLQLPYGHGGGGRCDERIGRFCYWYDEGDTALPAEPPSVTEARSRLLDHLAFLQRQLPGDDWLAGQRVRYLVEHGAPDAAVTSVRTCLATNWWCDALRGYAYHEAGQYGAADTAFRRAIDEMPAELVCDWTDWEWVMDSELLDRFEPGECDRWPAIADSVFWLAQPLWSREGNDLRTELLSRRVIDALLRVSRSPQATPWGKDVAELVVRYGWPDAWSQSERSAASLESGSVTGHDRTPAYAFFPRPGRESGDPAWRWDLATDRPRARYRPDYAPAFVRLESFQVARFPRADSTIVIGAVDLRDDTVFARAGVDAALAVAVRWLDRPAVDRRTEPGPTATLRVVAPGIPLAFSLEAEAVGGGRIARARAFVAPLGRRGNLVLSDPLLFEAGPTLPATLAMAAARALPSTRLRKERLVGVYWEASGPGADTLEVSVALVPKRRGLLGRIGQSLSLVKRRAPLSLQWTSAGGDGPVVGRAFELDLDRLARGEYLLRLTVTTPDGLELGVERPLELYD